MSVKVVVGCAVSFLVLASATAANAACNRIKSAAELQAIESDLGGTYCLTKDIDLSTIPNFTPIGGGMTPFSGKLRGGGFTIRNLTISSGASKIGLFGTIDGGTVDNLTLLNVKILATAENAGVGALAATVVNGAAISNVHVGGTLKCILNCSLGGFIGGGGGVTTVIEDSSSSARVTQPNNSGFTAGFAASMTSMTIRRSFATGSVTCAGGSGGFCAGFVGSTAGAVFLQDFATGAVTCGPNTFCGGFAGSAAGNTFKNVYATTSIVYDASSFVGTLIGSTAGGIFERNYGTGALVAETTLAPQLGGLIGSSATTVTNSYWDTETTGLATSSGGTGQTTAQLQAALLTGFNDTVWGISPTRSYPFLLNTSFRSTLATLVESSTVATFLPLAQLETFNYDGATENIGGASLATCYTMIARSIGETLRVKELRNIAIDEYFWVDATKKTLWQGPVTGFATRGPLRTVAPGDSLRRNVLAQFKANKLVLLRGTYNDGGKSRTAWMLGTSFTRAPDDTPDAIYANDPFTGKQVTIDPVTKTIIAPADFPLTNFTVDGFRSVALSLTQ